MPTDKPKEKKVVEILANVNLPVLSVDHLVVSVRGDDSCLLRFSAQLPEGVFEQAKMMVQRDKLEEMINVMCANLGYFPKKQSPNRKVPKKETTEKK